MDYSIEQITTLADCDMLLAKANDRKDDLAYKLHGENRQFQTILEGSASIEADLAGVSAEISAIESVLPSLSGENLEEYESKLQKLRHKKFLLEERRERYGVIGLLEQQFEVNSVQRQQAEIDLYIDALNHRRGELG